MKQLNQKEQSRRDRLLDELNDIKQDLDSKMCKIYLSEYKFLNSEIKTDIESSFDNLTRAVKKLGQL